ncbi:MAG: hypothetical protein KDD34_00170 [Bdellovibrionales bacterium]|nr:hypothetical protein [Bdellovibrionales bacterium]
MSIKWIYFILLILPSLCFSFTKGAAPLELRQMVLGSSCGTLIATSYSLPCHPALLPLESSQNFVANIFLGEHYQRVNAYRKDIQNKDEFGVIEKLFEEQKALQLQAGSALWVKSKYFSFSYIPLYMSYFSELKNRSYPQVDLKVYIEESLQLQGALPIQWDNTVISLGLQGRAVDRKFIFQEFALFDVLSDPSQLKIQSHKSLFLEPGIVILQDTDWKPRLTAQLKNLQVHHSGDRPPSELVGAFVDTGIGTSVPITFGNLDLGISYRHDREITDPWDRISFGTHYGLGLVATDLSLAQDAFSLGVSTQFLSARTGVAYFQNQVHEWDGSTSTNKTVNLEFGLVF